MPAARAKSKWVSETDRADPEAGLAYEPRSLATTASER